MGKIIILDENTANKIAAGEVIERPASVIKELVENSIDAGASSINVEIRNGGISFIRVIDNGSGIAGDDVEIAFERHATSKIRRVDDLESLSSMGFRGEALASIAAVSDVQMLTRVKDDVQGLNINVKGGFVKDIKPAGCPVGTSITVRELFFNTPARYKFLKKDSTEAGYAADVLSRIALGYPDISFKLVSNGTVLLHTPGNGDLKSAVFSIYGAETTKQLIDLNYEDVRVKISGFVGKAEIARSNRNYQSFYINRRYIRSKSITSAIDTAYSTFLMKNKFPFAVLDVRINPCLVDVNVHPSKMEVKFSSEQDIYRAVYNAVNSALLSGSSIRTLPGNRNTEKTTFTFNKDRSESKPAYTQEAFEWVRKELDHKRQEAISGNGFNSEDDKSSDKIAGISETAEVHKSSDEIAENSETAEECKSSDKIAGDWYNAAGEMSKTEESLLNTISSSKPIETHVFYTSSKSIGATTSKCPMNTDKTAVPEQLLKPGESNSSETGDSVIEADKTGYVSSDNKKPDYRVDTNYLYEKNDEGTLIVSEQVTESKSRYSTDLNLLKDARIIGQLFSTYILLEHEDELYLIDQHAAHERIRYEELKEAFCKNKPFSQTLLAVIPIELTGGEYQFAMNEMSFFEKLGFSYESFGSNSIILRSVPFNNNEQDNKETFMNVLNLVMSGSSGTKSSDADETLYQIACKSAVKANKKLNDLEIEALLNKLVLLENPYTCPHGRPSILKLSKYELEKLFKRIV